MKEYHKNGCKKTNIIQQYIDRPLLFKGRKFDIRCFMLFTSINGRQKAYWYKEGYLRTSSTKFSIKNLTNKMVHLTNDAIQKKGEEYGKFERGNKISFEEFSKYLENSNVNFEKVVYEPLKVLSIYQYIYEILMKAVYRKMDPTKLDPTFELFGIDYMIDENYNVYLIEANTNPSLEITSPLLSKIIPSLIDNILRLVLDPLFPPPHFYKFKKNFQDCLEVNNFELIFDDEEYDQETQLQKYNLNNSIDVFEEDEEQEFQ